MSEVTRVYAGRLAGMVVREPDTDVIGRVRDVIVNVRPAHHTSRVLGVVVEMTNKRRIFLPMLRSGMKGLPCFLQPALARRQASWLTQLIGHSTQSTDGSTCSMRLTDCSSPPS